MTATTTSSANEDLLHKLLVIGGIAGAAMLVLYLATANWDLPVPRDRTGLAVGRDFLNLWFMAEATASPDPGRLYDPAPYNAMLALVAGDGLPGQNWSYPPTMLLLAPLFRGLPYLAALALWSLAGLALFAFALSRLTTDRRVLLAGLVSPAAVFCLICGQNGLISGAILLTIFSCLDRRPVVAGVLIGLMTVKPQLGLLFPVMLLVSGRWRVIAAATVTALVLALVTTLVFGWKVWADYLSIGVPVQRYILSDPDRIATPFFPTVFMNLRGLDLPQIVPMIGQTAAAVVALAIAVIFFVRWRNAPVEISATLFLACSLTLSPYFLIYDLTALSAATVLLVARMPLDTTGQRLAQLVYCLPLLQLAFGQFHIPGPALIAPVFAACLLRLIGTSDGAAAPRSSLAAAGA